MKRNIYLLAGLLCVSSQLRAQDDLLGDLMKADSAIVKQNLTIATFKSTRVINMHSTEMTGVGNLEFFISHHFGSLWDKTQGVANIARLFGFNGGVANTYLSFDYSFKSWMNFSLAFAGRSTLEGSGKFKLLRQQTGLHNYPVSVVYLTTVNVNAAKDDPAPNGLVWNKFTYLHQLIIARKFSDKFSLQFVPTLVHQNIVSYGFGNNNDIFSLGLGGRMKISDKKAITFEFTRQLNMYNNVVDKTGEIVNYSPNLISLGYDWDTGGHIFQFFLTNCGSASNIIQLSQNPEKTRIGEFSLGFNLNRSYSIKHAVKTAH